MLDGVAVSKDGDAWSGLGSGLPRGAVWRVLDDHGGLMAATDGGLFGYALRSNPATGAWWILFAGALLAGTAGSLSRLGVADESGRGGRRTRAQPPPTRR